MLIITRCAYATISNRTRLAHDRVKYSLDGTDEQTDRPETNVFRRREQCFDLSVYSDRRVVGACKNNVADTNNNDMR